MCGPCVSRACRERVVQKPTINRWRSHRRASHTQFPPSTYEHECACVSTSGQHCHNDPRLWEWMCASHCCCATSEQLSKQQAQAQSAWGPPRAWHGSEQVSTLAFATWTKSPALLASSAGPFAEVACARISKEANLKQQSRAKQWTPKAESMNIQRLGEPFVR